jgi:uncharacterized membrane protein YgdD (TMEM256/DUF423 family)
MASLRDPHGQRRAVGGPVSRADVAWAGLIAAGCILEAAALYGGHIEDTLSARTRAWCRVSTPAGRIAFLAGWAAFSMWFGTHIAQGVSGDSSR